MKKEEKVVLSAATESSNEDTSCYECQVRHMGTIDEIWESEYDMEMNLIGFDFQFYNGEVLHINFKREHIEEMMLFMKKSQAEKRYVDFILNK